MQAQMQPEMVKALHKNQLDTIKAESMIDARERKTDASIQEAQRRTDAEISLKTQLAAAEVRIKELEASVTQQGA